MKHLIFIDPIEKLIIKKDTTLYFAAELKKRYPETYVFFENQISIGSNKSELSVYDFSYDQSSAFCVDQFELGVQKRISLAEGDIIHLRQEPPFDKNYLRNLWLLDFMKLSGAILLNSAAGIMNNNEKIYPLSKGDGIESFISKSSTDIETQLLKWSKQGISEVILKPLDLFQGIGVQKISVDDEQLNSKIKSALKEADGVLMAQPFIEKVKDGEVRSVYFNGTEIGSILKQPPKGEFLANIAQGASYQKYELNDSEKKKCDDQAKDLLSQGVSWVAFDILDGHISEANVTCPGLLVEVAKAHEKNLAHEIVQLISEEYP